MMHAIDPTSHPSITDAGTSPPQPPQPPSLPIELAESILVYNPLRFSLASLTGSDVAIHDTCAAALVALRPSTELLKVSTPRLLNGAMKVCANKHFDIKLLHRLHQSGFILFDRRTFKAALERDRVDILDWWASIAKLEPPRPPAGSNLGVVDSLAQHALAHKAWGSLEWLARTAFLESVDIGLLDRQLCALVETGGASEIQLVEQWLRSKMGVWDYEVMVAVPACEHGCMGVLEALLEGHRESVVDCDGATVHDCCAEAVKSGHTHVLEWMARKAGWKLDCVAEYACKYGRLNVLEWIKANKPESILADETRTSDTEYLDSGEPAFVPENELGYCLDLASSNGHVDVLQWLADNPDAVPLVYNRLAMDSASAEGHLDVLKWWKSQETSDSGFGLAPRYTEQALYSATLRGHLHVVEWWVKESGLELKYDPDTLLRQAYSAVEWETVFKWWIQESGVKWDLSKHTRVLSECDWQTATILDRWKQSGCSIPCNVADALCNAARIGHMDVLEWWKQSGIPLEFDHRLMDAASSGGSLKSLEAVTWVHQLHLDQGRDLQYSEAALDGIEWPVTQGNWVADAQRLSVIQWWLSSGLVVKYSDKAFVNAVIVMMAQGQRAGADWWVQQSGLPVRYTGEAVRQIVQNDPSRGRSLLSWMASKGLGLNGA